MSNKIELTEEQAEDIWNISCVPKDGFILRCKEKGWIIQNPVERYRETKHNYRGTITGIADAAIEYLEKQLEDK